MAYLWRSRGKDGKLHPRWHFEYRDWQGHRRKGTGTTSKAETLRIAEAMQARENDIRRGLRQPPKASDTPRAFGEVMEEYLAWGEAQGGLGGRPWGEYHLHMRKVHLAWWKEKLNPQTLADLKGSLPRVERLLRRLHKSGLAGKTCQNYAEALKCLCKWCVVRGYLDTDPLLKLTKFDTTPRDLRRALTQDELARLLAAAPPERRLVYEVAVSTGLRAREMRSLKVRHLDVARGGFHLEAAWTKNRKPGFQPLPRNVLHRVVAFIRGLGADDALFRVSTHIARSMKLDLKKAKVPERIPGEGKIDFHALRTTYATFILEAGATVKEAQTLLRHSTPVLTMNTYARTRADRLDKLAQHLGGVIESPQAEGKTRAAGA